MSGFLIAIHVFLVIILIAIILVQQPRGGGLGALFGGGAQDLLGVRGAPTFFQKLTWIIGGLIAVLAILIALLSKGPKTQVPVTQRTRAFQVVPLFQEETKEEQSGQILPIEKQDTSKEKK